MHIPKFIGVRIVTSILSVILFLSQPCQAKAQRTMNGQSILTAEVTALAAMCPGDFGINIDYGQYLLSGYWYCSLAGEHNRIATTTSYSIR